MAGKKQKEKSINENWEEAIAAYDAEYARIEKEFYGKHFIINESGNSELTEEENEVFILYLNGVPYAEIANQFSVENDVITGLIEVIKTKLSET